LTSRMRRQSAGSLSLKIDSRSTPALLTSPHAGPSSAPVRPRAASTEVRSLTSQECATELNERFARYFSDAAVRVQADDSILADAAAGNDYVKVRTGAKFSPRDVDILEVHEGWVHVATSLNGQAQPVAKWLSKGPPRTTAVQEGLAALLEIFTFRTYPRRARRLNDRMVARALAMGGTCTGEHGVGYGKMKFLEAEHGESLEVMRAIKRALDPDNRMNPGKIVDI